MPLDELTIGEEVKIYDKHIRGYKIGFTGKIVDLKPEYILVNRGYNERFDVIDFRRRRYRLFKSCGVEIKFPPIPDRKAIEKAMMQKIREEYLNSPAGKSQKAREEKRKAGLTVTWEKIKKLLDSGKTQEEIAEELNSEIRIIKSLINRQENKKRKEDEEMAIMTKEIVRKMAADGMDVDSIAKHFETSYPNVRPSVIKAKVTNLLSDKPMAPRKKKEDNPAAATENPLTPNPTPDEIGKVTYQTVIKGEEIIMKPEIQNGHEEKDQLRAIKAQKEVLAPEAKKLYEKNPEAALSGPILKPKCMVGGLTGREYIFFNGGIDFGIELTWDELDNLIAELQAIKKMRSA